MLNDNIDFATITIVNLQGAQSALAGHGHDSGASYSRNILNLISKTSVTSLQTDQLQSFKRWITAKHCNPPFSMMPTTGCVCMC